MNMLRKIEIPEAKRLHNNYMVNPTGGGQTSSAVVINIKEAFDRLIPDRVGKRGIDNIEQIEFNTLVCYFARYDNDDNDELKINRNTVLIHLANTNDTGVVTVIAGEIYNFGDLKPPKTIVGEQIILP